MTRLAHQVFILIIVAMLLGPAILFFYWLVVDIDPPLTITYVHPVPITDEGNKRAALVDKPTARAGETVYVWREWTVAKETRCQVRRRLEDGASLAIVGENYLEEPGDYSQRFEITLPKFLTPGSYRYTVNLSCQNNPLSISNIVVPSVMIRVIK